MKDDVVCGQRVRCYDKGRGADRYTAVLVDQPAYGVCVLGALRCLSMGPDPFHPQGFGQHAVAVIGPHLGQRVPFADMPADCRQFVEGEFQ